MDSILDDLERTARKCERTSRSWECGPVGEAIKRLHNACKMIHEAWCGSFISYHAYVYTVGLRPRSPGEHFDSEWGGLKRFNNRSTGDWAEYTYQGIELGILQYASVETTIEIQQAVSQAAAVFCDCKEDLLPTVDAVLAEKDDSVLREQRIKLVNLMSHISARQFEDQFIPDGEYRSRDSIAISQGVKLPHHMKFQAWVLECESCLHNLKELAKIARYVRRYLEKRLNMKGTSVAKTTGKIFIGHGRSPVWRDLKDLIQDRLKLDWDEFNREPTAGKSTKERLEAMLDNACFAFLVMTAEDEVGEEKKQARANVIHEVGLFQGRLGFERAIVLLEEGCEEFSNIVGLSQIRFPKGNVMAKTEEIRRVLEREQIVKS